MGTDEGCKKIIEDEWQKRYEATTNIEGVQERLKYCNSTLQKWRKKYCSEVEKKIKGKKPIIEAITRCWKGREYRWYSKVVKGIRSFA